MSQEQSQYTMDHFFKNVVENYRSRPSIALAGETRPMTYGEFGLKVENLRNTLIKLDLKKGDKIIITGVSSSNWAIAFMAITTLGAVAVPVMEEFPEADIEHLIKHSGAEAVFISEQLYRNLHLPALKRVQIILNLDNFSFFTEKHPHKKFEDQLQAIAAKRKKMRKKSSPAKKQSEPDQTIQEDDLAEILYTSGTTGHSKGVMLTHKNLISNALSGANAFTDLLHEHSVAFSILPMAHAFGSTCAFLAMISAGANLYILGQKPTPKVLLSAMQKIRPTLFLTVPLIFEKIYHKQVLPRLNQNKILQFLSSYKWGKKLLFKIIGQKIKALLGGRLACAVIGGASLNHEVETFLKEGKIPYIVGYGLSECAPVVSVSKLAEMKIGSAGRALKGVSIKILDPDPESGIGEILVKGPNIMLGYYQDSIETARVLTEDRWLKTGDLGYLDRDNYLFIMGRSKNVVVGPSGENIYPEAIEDKLKESRLVEEALVYQADQHLVARIYLDYNYIETLSKQMDEHNIALNIQQMLNQIKADVNKKLSPASRIHKLIEQREPFKKTPTQKIKRGEYYELGENLPIHSLKAEK